MDTTVDALKSYASWHIAKLGETDAALLPLSQLVIERFRANEPDTQILPQEEAEGYVVIPLNPKDFPGNTFDTQLLRDCYDIAIKTIEIAADPHSTNEHMVKVARYLHPLLSLDDSTIMIGRDLEEYMDWYFADDISAEERSKHLEELVSDWEYLRLKFTS